MSLWVRLQLKDPMLVLATALQTRLATAHDGNVVHMQTATVQQWWNSLPSRFEQVCFGDKNRHRGHAALEVRVGDGPSASHPVSIKEVTHVTLSPALSVVFPF